MKFLSFPSSSSMLLLCLATMRIRAFAPRPTSSTLVKHQTSLVQAAATASAAVPFDMSTTSLSYASSVEHPPPETSDFTKRMRNLAIPQTRPKKNTSLATVGRPSTVIEVTTLEDYKRVVADEQDKLVVVRFYAPWCRACKAAAPSFYRVAREYANEVKFVDVPVTQESTKIILQGLSVPSIPFAHIYHPQAGLVEELRMTRKRFSQFENALKSYVSESCDIADFDYSNPNVVAA